MNFRSSRSRHRTAGNEEPEINLIPFIDVLLVILIFMMVTTTYQKYAELQINLPSTNAINDPAQVKPVEVLVSVNAEGKYTIDGQPVNARNAADLSTLLAERAPNGQVDGVPVILIIYADGNATHQSVMNIMEAARNVGIHQQTIATQTTAQ